MVLMTFEGKANVTKKQCSARERKGGQHLG